MCHVNSGACGLRGGDGAVARGGVEKSTSSATVGAEKCVTCRREMRRSCERKSGCRLMVTFPRRLFTNATFAFSTKAVGNSAQNVVRRRSAWSSSFPRKSSGKANSARQQQQQQQQLSRAKEIVSNLYFSSIFLTRVSVCVCVSQWMSVSECVSVWMWWWTEQRATRIKNECPKVPNTNNKKKKRDENRRIYINGKQILLFLSRAKKITNCSVSMPSNQKKMKNKKIKRRKQWKAIKVINEKGGMANRTESKSKKSMPFLRNYTLRIRDMYRGSQVK